MSCCFQYCVGGGYNSNKGTNAGFILSFNSNGSYSQGDSKDSSSWTLNDREPLILKLYDEKGNLDELLHFSFINENTFEISMEGQHEKYIRKQ